jgi:hypothetical protein
MAQSPAYGARGWRRLVSALTVALACAAVVHCLRPSLFAQSTHPERLAFKQRALENNKVPAGGFDFMKQGRTNALVIVDGARRVSLALDDGRHPIRDHTSSAPENPYG